MKDCGSADASKSIDEIKAKLNLDATYSQPWKENFGKGVRASVRLVRGNLCALCVDPANADNFFDSDGRLIINEEDYTKYSNEMGDAMAPV